MLHVFFLTAYAACARIAACDNLTEDCKVRRYSEEALSTCHTDTEACNNLIEYKECAILTAKSFNALVELIVKRGCTAFGAYRLDVNSSCAATELIEPKLSFKILKIAGEELLHVFEDVKRNAACLCEL